ncbi:MAG: RNA 3'-terminal phosphate cyclase [Candidatus Micrarchaeia archaeon]|jgi:RNA 3'-terminal phosphate cyclase (ATP)
MLEIDSTTRARPPSSGRAAEAGRAEAEGAWAAHTGLQARVVDGSQGEGGGQVLRTALSLSCVLQAPVRITNIRAGRPKPGLAAQHLTVCNLLSEICGARMHGATLGSTELTFLPGKISGGDYKFDIGTAGSCTLLLQAALPVLAHAAHPSSLEVIGGTHVSHSPSFEYFSEVFLPAARKFGVRAEAKMQRAGFYPKGGGIVSLKAEPSKLRGCKFLPEAQQVKYSILASSLPPHVLQREEAEVKKLFPGATGGARAVEASCAGNALTVWSGAFGASALGERGKPAEKVAQEACAELMRGMQAGDGARQGAILQPGCSVDSHLADQLLIHAVLAEGKTEFSTPAFSPHLLTNADVMRAMTGRNITFGSDRVAKVEG